MCLSFKGFAYRDDGQMQEAGKQCSPAELCHVGIPAEFVAMRATDFFGMIRDCDEAGFPKHLLFASLGRSLSVVDPPESERLSILNEAWKVITIVCSPRTVNQLAMETRRVMKGNHSPKTAAFVRACAAYSVITIPSLTNIFSRLNLYLLSGQVALANQCLSQGECWSLS
ncbi:UPF0505 protein C16orf62 homolog [Carassius auratus]|uniref:VPS35 endosomal protein-sorting factor-like n=1 Tax=Carassius auratus TaxID=7957 RepID=A0A6P6QIZ2_CARAU|nr:UPF0505 protein C16orf62 homolog [Carassius auratus]